MDARNRFIGINLRKNNMKPAKNLTCCCCGDICRGRQWYNRDTGYGLCQNCTERQKKTETKEYMIECYGREGEHYNLMKKDIQNGS